MSDQAKIIEVMAEAVRVSRINDVYDADEIASDILAHLSAEGMEVVPVEPTPEMAANGARHLDGYDVISADLTPHTAESIYAAMLSASPYGKASMQEASAERAARSEQKEEGK